MINQTYEFFLRLQTSRAIDALPNITYCPKQECNTPTENGDPNSTNVRCGQCNYWYCTKCLERGHQGVCDTFEDLNSTADQGHNRPFMHLPGTIESEDHKREARKRRKKEEKKTLEALKRSDDKKQCPGCKIWIERITGCDHMTCTKCEVSLPKD